MEEEEQQFRGGRKKAEASEKRSAPLTVTTLSLLNPNTSPQPTEFPCLELRRRPAAEARRCGLFVLQWLSCRRFFSYLLFFFFFLISTFLSDGIEEKASALSAP